jgi:hypothetical protein
MDNEDVCKLCGYLFGISQAESDTVHHIVMHRYKLSVPTVARCYKFIDSYSVKGNSNRETIVITDSSCGFSCCETSLLHLC